MKKIEELKFYSKREELANTLSHSAGILLGVTVGFILLRESILNQSIWDISSVLLYLFGMLGSYITSVLYHAHLCPIQPDYTPRSWGLGLESLLLRICGCHCGHIHELQKIEKT